MGSFSTESNGSSRNKKTAIKMKRAFNKLLSRLDRGEERNKKLEDRSKEITQTETKREYSLKKSKSCGTIRNSLTYAYVLVIHCCVTNYPKT